MSPVCVSLLRSGIPRPLTHARVDVVGQGLWPGCSRLSSLLGHSHPTSCCSAAEIMAVLFFHTMRYKALDPRNPHNDRFVLSKVRALLLATPTWGRALWVPWNGGE